MNKTINSRDFAALAVQSVKFSKRASPEDIEHLLNVYITAYDLVEEHNTSIRKKNTGWTD